MRQWDVFGGHVEPGESREQALVRELIEEFGIVPTTFRYLETPTEANSTEANAVECHLYVVTEWTGDPTNRQPDEHADLRWFGLACHPEFAHPDYVRVLQASTLPLPMNTGVEEELDDPNGMQTES